MHMKIRRANMITHTWINCLNLDFQQMDARNEGWEVKEFNSTERLVPIWYTGNPLPTDEEYDEHILEHVLAMYKNVETDQLTSDLEDVSEDSESDSEPDDYANSESDSSDADD